MSLSPPELQLIHLLREHFEPPEVHALLSALPDQQELTAHAQTLPTTGAFSVYVVRALVSRGLVGRPLFERLAAARPSLVGPIWGIAALFGLSHPDLSANAGADLGAIAPLPAHLEETLEAELERSATLGHEAQEERLFEVLLSRDDPNQADHVCYLYGDAGVGKSALARRYLRTNLDELPGGLLQITLKEGRAPSPDLLIMTLAGRLGVHQGQRPMEENLRRAALAICPMIHIENMNTYGLAHSVIALTQRLPGVPILVSGRHTLDPVPPGWRVLPVEPLSVSESLAVLGVTLSPEVEPNVPLATRRALVTALGGLPLSIHLAARYLSAGGRADELLSALSAAPTSGAQTPQRALDVLFDLSMGALRAALGDEGDAGARGVAALGFAPQAGVGRSWSEAIVGAPPETVSRWVGPAVTLGIVQHDARRGRWWVPPALAERLRAALRGDQDAQSSRERGLSPWAKALVWVRAALFGVTLSDVDKAVARLDGWVLERLSATPQQTRGLRFSALQAEGEAINEWAAALDGPRALTASLKGFEYASSSGTVVVWMYTNTCALEDLQDVRRRSILLRQLGRLSIQAGFFEITSQLANLKAEQDSAHGLDNGIFDAAELRAGLAVAFGRLDQALRTYREVLLPAYTRREDRRSELRIQQKVAGILVALGDPEEALRLLREEVSPALDSTNDLTLKAAVSRTLADAQEALAQHAEGLYILREQVLPLQMQLGDSRGVASTLFKIASVQMQLGQPRVALQMLREEVLPLNERLGDVPGKALTTQAIADALARTKQFDEALTLLRQRVIPVQDGLGDGHGLALTVCMIAEVLQAQGHLKEALRVRREEELVMYEQLGAEHKKAFAKGKIANLLHALGQHDEAITLLRKEVMPTFVRTQALFWQAHTISQIADLTTAQGQTEAALKIRRDEEIPLYQKLGDEHRVAISKSQIGSLMESLGQLDEAAQMWRSLVPEFARLGDIHAKAQMLHTLADVAATQGDIDEALRIRREEELIHYEQLGDDLGRALTMNKIALLIQSQGQQDEAIQIWRSLVPVLERLGDLVGKTRMVSSVANALQLQKKYDEALKVLREEELVLLQQLGDQHNQAHTLGKIAGILHAQGKPDEAEPLWREALSIFRRFDDKLGTRHALRPLSDVLRDQGKLDEALRVLRDELLVLCEQSGDEPMKAKTMCLIVRLYQDLERLEEAEQLCGEVLPLFERLGDVIGAANTQLKLGELHHLQGRLDEAKHRCEEALARFNQLGELGGKALALSRLADVLDSQGEVDEAHRIRRDEALDLFNRLGDEPGKARIMTQIGRLLYSRGQLDEAKTVLEELLPILERLKNLEGQVFVVSKLADVLADQGDTEGALRLQRGELMPRVEALGNPRTLVVAQTNMSINLLRSGRPERFGEALTLLFTALERAVALDFPPEAEHVRSVIARFNLPVPDPDLTT